MACPSHLGSDTEELAVLILAFNFILRQLFLILVLIFYIAGPLTEGLLYLAF